MAKFNRGWVDTKYNKEEIRDKIKACWIGKNIGGTMGGPYEWASEILDVKGFSTEKGSPLPNDDLDLQLVWLYAMEKEGPYNMSPAMLGEYWVSYVTPYWNEYGIGKANFKEGLLSPMSGGFNNDKWKTSNGAWIRSEVWACLAPGYPSVAAKYAVMDAMMDHGVNEGTYAEIFTATIESYAFFENDIRKIINLGLERIPAESRVAKAVKLVLDEYDKGTDWKDVRNMLVEQSKDIGMFQAPANLGFTILGLMYGEGDFKKSMLLAINCGDDTDCTAATLGAFMGILNGMKGIPADWQEYIGDNIITISVNGSLHEVPKTCSELTERTMNMIIPTLKANNIVAEFTTDKTEFDASKDIEFEGVGNLNNNSFELKLAPISKVKVELSKGPKLEKNEELEVSLTFVNQMKDQRYLYLDYVVSEGLEISGESRSVFNSDPNGDTVKFKVKAKENIGNKNSINILVSAKEHPTVYVIPIKIFG